MRWYWTDDGWRKRFAILPLFLCDGHLRQVVWLERYWSRSCGDCTDISLVDPHPNNTGEV